jgi:hypothetical protein
MEPNTINTCFFLLIESNTQDAIEKTTQVGLHQDEDTDRKDDNGNGNGNGNMAMANHLPPASIRIPTPNSSRPPTDMVILIRILTLPRPPPPIRSW